MPWYLMRCSEVHREQSPAGKDLWWMTGMSMSCLARNSKKRRPACTLETPSATSNRASTASDSCRRGWSLGGEGKEKAGRRCLCGESDTTPPPPPCVAFAPRCRPQLCLLWREVTNFQQSSKREAPLGKSFRTYLTLILMQPHPSECCNTSTSYRTAWKHYSSSSPQRSPPPGPY